MKKTFLVGLSIFVIIGAIVSTYFLVQAKNKHEEQVDICCNECLKYATDDDASCRLIIKNNGGFKKCLLDFDEKMGKDRTVKECKKNTTK
jgi:hypothetical protein